MLIYEGKIAACGMNCGVCIGHLREKKPCGGCYKKDDKNKPGACRSCSIVNCPNLIESKAGFCFECPEYPCRRLQQLDKRYRTKYRMSMIENLNYIRDFGMQSFLEKEEERWRCNHCGAGVSVHRNTCLHCNALLN